MGIRVRFEPVERLHDVAVSIATHAFASIGHGASPFGLTSNFGYGPPRRQHIPASTRGWLVFARISSETIALEQYQAEPVPMPIDRLLAGKRGLIMGVANERSIAWGVAERLHA